MAKYTWVITQEDAPLDVSSAFAKIGPSGASGRMSLGQVIQNGEHFRLLSDDGKVRYSGYIHGEYAGREPLDDYGNLNNCVDIEYEVGDRWTALDGTTREQIRA